MVCKFQSSVPLFGDMHRFCHNRMSVKIRKDVNCPGDCTMREKGRPRVYQEHVPSRSNRGEGHEVVFDGKKWTCNCPGGKFRGKCWAITDVRRRFSQCGE